jgi:hypothetical protein
MRFARDDVIACRAFDDEYAALVSARGNAQLVPGADDDDDDRAHEDSDEQDSVDRSDDVRELRRAVLIEQQARTLAHSSTLSGVHAQKNALLKERVQRVQNASSAVCVTALTTRLRLGVATILCSVLLQLI